MTCYLLSAAIRKARTRPALTMALPIIHGLCLAPPALAIGAYSPGYEPDKLLLQMTDVVSVPDPNAPRYAAPLGDPTFALTGSPGTASVVVDIGKNVDLPNPTKYYAITGIGILERSDNPCQITLWGKMVDRRYPSFGRKLAVFELDKCRENKLSPWLDYKSVDFRTAEGKFVRSVRVCSGHIPPLGFLPPQGAHSFPRVGHQGAHDPPRTCLAGSRRGHLSNRPENLCSTDLPERSGCADLGSRMERLVQLP